MAALLIAMLITAAFTLTSSVALAQGSTDASNAEARALFEEGLRFVESQQWQEAADRFGRVLAIRASVTVSYNYASALVHLNRIVEASRVLRGVVADPAAPREVLTAARTLLAEVEPRIGQVTVRLRGDTTDVLVTIDDKPLPEGSIGVPVPLDPGEHVVRATRGGVPLARRVVEVTDATPLTHVEIDVVPLPSAVAASAAPAGTSDTQPVPLNDTADDSGGGTWLWITGGSVLAVGAIVVVGLLIASPSDPDPVRGNVDPFVIRGRVATP